MKLGPDISRFPISRFRPDHSKKIALRFQIFPLCRAFSNVCVFVENESPCSSFPCGCETKTQQNVLKRITVFIVSVWMRDENATKTFVLLNENVFVWTPLFLARSLHFQYGRRNCASPKQGTSFTDKSTYSEKQDCLRHALPFRLLNLLRYKTDPVKI